MINNNSDSIEATIDKYFQGTYQGDEKLLRAAFYPSARICGFFAGTLIDLSVDEFINRACNEVIHTKYDKHIVSIDSQDDIAVVKAKALVDDTYFIDFISLICIEGTWLIRHKAFMALP